jgi:hypothetical protein
MFLYEVPMFRHLFCAASLAGACAAAGASETWTFVYTGFLDTTDNTFLPDHKLPGSFTGYDSNRNGIMERAEITSLFLGGKDYVACGADSNEYYSCGADTFSYSTLAGLSFSAGESGRDPEGWVGGGHYYISGDGEYTYAYRPGHEESQAYLWTAQTGFSITSPGPEPGTWSMLGVGVLVTGWAARRHRARK